MTSEKGEKLNRPTDEISKDWVAENTINFSQHVTPDEPPEPPPLNGIILNCPLQAMVNVILLYFHSCLSSSHLQDILVSFKSATAYIDACIGVERTHPSDPGASA